MAANQAPPAGETPKKRSAFTELMAPKPKQPQHAPTHASPSPRAYGSDPRGGLLEYIKEPETDPHGLVVQYDDDWVLIRDLYGKATVHLLLLSRDPSKYLLHPRDALADLGFLHDVQAKAAVWRCLAARELRRLFGQDSALDKPLNDAMELPEPPDDLPAGRDWEKELQVGVHAHPSMTHLHVHIISRDMKSDALKHRKHYNSFNTDFFIPLADYPLAEDDIRRDTHHQNDNLRKDFRCWRCGKNFGNKFKALKDHLDGEFDAWKRE